MDVAEEIEKLLADLDWDIEAEVKELNESMEAFWKEMFPDMTQTECS